MMSVQFQKTVTRALKNKSDRLKKKLEQSIREHAENIIELLRRKATSFGRYGAGQGVGVYSDKNSQYSASKWRTHRKKSGVSKDSVTYVFRNDAVAKHNRYPYIKSIYGKDSNYRWKNGKVGAAFRSKKLSESRWEGFKKFVLKAMSDKIKYDIHKGDKF